MAVVSNSAIHEKNKDCTCEKCKNSWMRAFHSHAAKLQNISSEKAVADVPIDKLKGNVRKGDRVLVEGSALKRKEDRQYVGTVQYVSNEDDHLVAPKMHVGVCLYDNVYSSHNGVFQGKRYFFCPRGHGVMVRSSDVKPLSPVLRTWPLSGNQMFPSYEGVKKRRKLREQIIREAEEKLNNEYKGRRRAQMERVSRSATHLYASDNANNKTYDVIQYPDQDEQDTAYSDYMTRRQNQTRTTSKESLEEIELRKLKMAFGGDEKAERMVQTLRKLRRAFQEGLAITLEGKD